MRAANPDLSDTAADAHEAGAVGFEGQVSGPVKRRDDLALRRVQNELLLLDMEFQRIHQLNETASFIWDMWNQAPDTGEIARLLAQKFDVDEHVALSDVSEVVRKLRELKLLVA